MRSRSALERKMFLTLIAAGDDVPDGTRILESKRTCHIGTEATSETQARRRRRRKRRRGRQNLPGMEDAST
jgi:chloramphenicol 3-O-phosphotransferase